MERTELIPSSVDTKTWLHFLRTPTKIPNSHLEFNFCLTFPNLLFQKTFSPNSIPSTVGLFPFTLSYATFPSVPLCNLLKRYAAYSGIKATTLSLAFKLLPNLACKPNQIDLICPSISSTILSTSPLLPLLPNGECSTTVRRP